MDGPAAPLCVFPGTERPCIFVGENVNDTNPAPRCPMSQGYDLPGGFAHLDPDLATMHEAIGLLNSIHILEDRRVCKFIRRTRNKHGIVPPQNRVQRDENLARFPPECFLNPARQQARAFLQRDLLHVLCTDDEAHPLLSIRLFDLFPFSLLKPLVMRLLSRFLNIDEMVETGARAIARHIVTDIYEVPRPTAVLGSLVGTCDVAESGVIVAVIFPWTDLDAVGKQIGELYRRTFVPGKRDRLPDLYEQTAWLRFCSRRLAKDPAFKANPNQHLAKIELELTASDPAPLECDPFSYQALVEDMAEAIRKRIAAFPKVQDRFLTYRRDRPS
jgi:hypothetical protein